MLSYDSDRVQRNPRWRFHEFDEQLANGGWDRDGYPFAFTPHGAVCDSLSISQDNNKPNEALRWFHIRAQLECGHRGVKSQRERDTRGVAPRVPRAIQDRIIVRRQQELRAEWTVCKPSAMRGVDAYKLGHAAPKRENQLWRCRKVFFN